MDSFHLTSESFQSLEQTQKTSVKTGDVVRVPSNGSTAAEPNGTSSQYPKGSRLAIIILSLAASVFLVALDETIITTAIPRITDEFDSLTDVGWYGSAYFLTLCSFQLVYGKLFTFFPVKWVFLTSLAIFEVGSIVCATAHSSDIFIVGRAIAGLGSGGINAGYIIILAAALPLERRPIFVASYSMMYGVATVSAPIMGGAFTTRLTWRWCFWINLPFGGLTLAVIYLFFHTHDTHPASRLSLAQKWRQLDAIGTAIVVVGVACLLLILQWGGSRYTWNNWRIILLIIMFSLLIIAFVVVQIVRQETATIPPRIIRKRSVAFSAWFVFAAGAAMNVMEYYLPIYFQAIKGDSALQSGIKILPTILGVVVFSLVAGFGVSRLGYYTPFMLSGSVILCIGIGLCTTWKVSTSTAVWIGFQILIGAGGGLGIQQAHTAAQRVLAADDVPTGAVVLIFAQILGGTVFISVAENVFENRLVREVRQVLPTFDAHVLVDTGATSLRGVVQSDQLPAVLQAYDRALSQTFYVGVALAALSFIGAAGTEWLSIKKKTGDCEEDVSI